MKKRRGTPGLVKSIVQADYPGISDIPSPRNLIALVQGRLGVRVSYSTAWRARNEAVNEVRGTSEEGFSLLASYLYMLEKVNEGTVTRVECDEQGKFKFLFIALGACIEGFQAMRKVIIIDGTHLSGKYGGLLLIATAQDPDRHHYPLAFGVGDKETNASWGFFLKMLKTIVPDDPSLVIVSDRNQSIIKLVGEVYPKAKHGFCVWHLSQNVKLRVFGKNKEVAAGNFRNCAKLYTKAEFLQEF